MADALPGNRERAVVFLHGSNRTFDRAWPIAAHVEHARFAVMPGYGDGAAVPFEQDAWESTLIGTCSPGAVVVAHSYGGPIAMRAAARRPDLIAGLVLFEPAAYALARGNAAVEAHIDRVQPVLDTAAEIGTAQFAVAFAAALTGTAGTSPVSPDELLAADRQRRLPGPWAMGPGYAVGRRRADARDHRRLERGVRSNCFAAAPCPTDDSHRLRTSATGSSGRR